VADPPGRGRAVSLPPELADLLSARDEAAATSAWDAFLETYSRLLLHTARSTAKDREAAMGGYAYVLEKLHEDDIARLRRLTGGDRDNLSRWLVVVSRRMCLDLHRQRYGRTRGGACGAAAPNRVSVVGPAPAACPVRLAAPAPPPSTSRTRPPNPTKLSLLVAFL
jgi:DNA-directed RNA polymerase specialized sigma24 family protein